MSIDREATVGFWSSAGQTVYDASPARVFQAALRGAAECRFGVMNANADAMFIQMQTPERSKHWDGVLSVSVVPEGAGAIVTISDALSGPASTLSELAASGAVALARGRLDAAIQRAVQSIVQAQASKVETDPSYSVADEIMKLKQLLDAGGLTESEFAAAKQRALG